MTSQNPHIAEAVAFFGGQAALASAIQCSQQLVSIMLNGGLITAETAVRIHAATNGAVSRAALRPDLFGPEFRHTSVPAVDGSLGVCIRMMVPGCAAPIPVRVHGSDIRFEIDPIDFLSVRPTHRVSS